MTDQSTAVAVREPTALTVRPVEVNLDNWPSAQYNRLVPTQTLLMPSDLIAPVFQIVQLEPADREGKSPDHYKSSDVPQGHRAPTARGLNKLATAAGVSFYDERRIDDGADPDVIGVSVMASMMLPTGQRITAPGSQLINIRTWFGSQTSAAELAKFRKQFYAHVSTRARNRAIRGLLSLRASYPEAEIAKPFAVVSFAPNMNHPEVRSRMLDAVSGVSAQLYGPAAARQLEAGKTINVSPAPEEDPAPATPTVLPGESLAKASGPVEEPDWLKPSTPAAAEAAPTKRRGAKSLPERLRESYDASELQGDASESQRLVLRDLVKDLPWATELYPVLAAAFGPEWDGTLDAPTVQAILNVAEAFSAAEPPIDFAAAWRKASADAKKAGDPS